MRYRSTFETEVAAELPGWSYEPTQLKYTVERRYTPDFMYQDVVVECKGWFRNNDTAKYLAIKKACEAQGLRFVFVLYTPNKRVRKGAKSSMADWCDKHEIPWFTLETLEDLKAYVHA